MTEADGGAAFLEILGRLPADAQAALYRYAERLALSYGAQGTPRSGFRDLLGMQTAEAPPGRAEVTLDVRPEMLNRGGILHGGAFCALADQAIGHAVHSTLGEGGHAVTTELKVNFLRAVTGGRVIGKGRLLRRGRHLVVGEADLVDGTDALCGKAMGTWMILNPDRGA